MDEQGVFGTGVKVVPSGEVWNVTVVLKLPVVEKVIRQLTQGEPPERFDCLAWVASPEKLNVKLQSGVMVCA